MENGGWRGRRIFSAILYLPSSIFASRSPPCRVGFAHRANKTVGRAHPTGALLQLLDVDVLEPERVAVVLEFDLAGGEDRLLGVPVVLEDDAVDDEDVVQLHPDLVADHLDPEAVPL